MVPVNHHVSRPKLSSLLFVLITHVPHTCPPGNLHGVIPGCSDQDVGSLTWTIPVCRPNTRAANTAWNPRQPASSLQLSRCYPSHPKWTSCGRRSWMTLGHIRVCCRTPGTNACSFQYHDQPSSQAQASLSTRAVPYPCTSPRPLARSSSYRVSPTRPPDSPAFAAYWKMPLVICLHCASISSASAVGSFVFSSHAEVWLGPLSATMRRTYI